MLINLLNISPRVSFDISPRVSSQRACRASISARDKSRHLSGSIPSEWGLLPLVNITLLGNRLTGPIPKEIGNIITLERLVLENNQLSGTLPPELGRLSNLKRLFLSSNKFRVILKTDQHEDFGSLCKWVIWTYTFVNRSSHKAERFNDKRYDWT
ncbi:Leucine-rich repeat (LRR) family protein [Arabidopsis thaliana]|uniref:Leucine-rich repeat (LRR) family protein n=1 Tax=Arabidopsis thaliana TaxID=3702 RepID=F4JLQ0_ARATH|nr:Leucine-rich repeat (LRR) family protein [Arabidopsis thaliana]AEE83709.1 Leucine-rich repeat (LRR) family protein [Arabidopsis thaliana]|eukprot:NP_001154241.1 Leucine-rich repeat (LRR) family protein [Arabidopsis thaliana]